MKALLSNRVSVLLAALSALVVFSGFGSCGHEVICPGPPVQECKGDSDCPSTYYCAISKTPRTRVANKNKAEPGGTLLGVRCADVPDDSGLKINCIDMDDDDDVHTEPAPTGFCKPRPTPTPPKTSCVRDSDCADGYSCQRVSVALGCPDPRAKCAPPTGKGVCVKKVKPRKPRRRRRRRPSICEADSDCKASQVCKIITTDCKTEPGGTSTNGATRRDGDDEPGYIPCKPQKHGICVTRPKKPSVRHCSKDSQCNSGEICDKVARTQQGSGSSGSSPKCGTRSKCGTGSADAPAAPMPPLPPGICRPAPKRSCTNNGDCKRGEICRLGKQTEPAPAPPKSRKAGTQDDDPDADNDECVEPPPAPRGYCAPAPSKTNPAPEPDKAP